jgi:hypothetical protein
MSGKAILVVSEELIKKIDENRGDLSRAEFTDFCIDSLLAEEQVKGERGVPEKEVGWSQLPQAGAYVSREDFEEFKQSIKDLLKAFIDFFTSYGLELANNSRAGECQ